jgi:hypothetical protein
MRRVTASFAAAALVTSAMFVAQSNSVEAHVQTTTVSHTCTAYPDTTLAPPSATNVELTFNTDAQDTVLAGGAINATIQLDPIEVPATNSGYTVSYMRDVVLKLPVPANVSYSSGSLSGNSAGWSISQSAGVITVSTSNQYSGGTFITPPQVNLNFNATGVVGADVKLRLGGNPPFNDSSNPSLQTLVRVAGTPIGDLNVAVKCYAPGAPAPLLHSTSIVAPDTSGPAITITTPADGGSYPLGSAINANYSCSDPSGVLSCVGTVANGTPIDTSTPGPHTFTVNASDVLTNASSSSVSYNVTTDPLISVRRGTRAESGGPIPFNVSISRPATSVITVDWALNDASADASDYVDGGGTLTWNPSDPLAQTVNVDLIDDPLHESSEQFEFALSGAVNAQVANPSSFGRIIDDDPSGVAATCGTAIEGSAISCTVTVTDHNNAPVTVDYSTANGTASAGSDFVTTNGSLTFAAGPPTSQSVTVNTVGDSVYESPEVELFGFDVLIPANGATATANATIVDNDSSVSPVRVSIGDLVVREGDIGGTGKRNVKLTVSLNKPASGTVTVGYSTVNGTAVTPSDYTAKVGKTLTFSPGQISKPITIVTIADDTNEGASEAFNVNLTSITGAVLNDSTGTVTMIDDDNPNVAVGAFAVGDITVIEGDSGTQAKVYVPIFLTRPAAVATSVKWKTVTVSGGANTLDFVAQVTAKNLTFKAGQRVKYAVIRINADTTSEANEAFNVALEGNLGATILDAAGAVTIVNNDTGTGVPGAPENLSATTAATTLGGVSLTWDTPASAGDRPISGYEFQRSNDGGDTFTPWAATGSGIDRHLTDGGCGQGAICLYAVRAVNGNGAGSPATSSSVVGLADTVAPDLNLVTPADGSNTDDDTGVVISGDIGIDGGDSFDADVDIFAGPDTSGALVEHIDLTPAAGEFLLTRSLSAGIYTVVADQSDWAGNSTTAVERTFEVRDAIFVAPFGNDADPGTAAAPKLTVQGGLDAAAATANADHVAVATGTYAEGDGVEPTATVAVLGGFDAASGWARPGSAGTSGSVDEAATTIEGVPQAATVNGAISVTFDSLTIKGRNTGLGAGASVYGIRALGGSTVAVVNSAVSAAAAVDGTDGSDGTDGGNGTNAGNGNMGTEPCSGTNTGGTLGSGGTGSGRNGGAGGTSPCGANGNAGGTGVVAGSGGGAGGGGGSKSGSIVCGNGDPGGGGGGGGAGTAGSAGGAGASVLGASSSYSPGDGTSGTNGNHGHGGGGGGGGGGSDANIFGGAVCAGYDYGGSGGGGGGGGARGNGGTGGTGGGGSFAIYSVNSSVTLDTDSSATSGDGGDGGSGGVGGDAGSGGAGGQGGSVGTGGEPNEGNADTPPLDFDTEPDGGPGGAGGGGGGAGGGGGGGGGAAGPSVAIYHVGTGTVTADGTLTRGAAGVAGIGGAGGAGGVGGAGGAIAVGNWTTAPNAGASGSSGATASNASGGGAAVACRVYSGGSCQVS